MSPEAPAYTLDPAQLEGAFEALRKAAETFRPSPREARLHRWLGWCSALAVILFVGLLASFGTGISLAAIENLAAALLALGAVAALLMLVNASLVAGTMRQRRLLKKLGLLTVSRSAWKVERRRSFRGWIGASVTTGGVALLVFAGIVLVFFELGDLRSGEYAISAAWEIGLIALFAVPGFTVLVWRMIERTRQQLALVADADRLRAILASMQARSGSGSVVVPAVVMEKVARIESAQIARERAQAVVASVGSPDRGYALVVAPAATVQKAALGRAERLAVEELIDDLLADPQAGGSPDPGSLRQVRSADGVIEIDYRIDQPAQRVHLLAVRVAGSAMVGC